MKFSRKIVSLCLVLTFIMSVCTFHVASAAVDALTATDVGEDYITVEWPKNIHNGVHYKVQKDGADYADIADENVTTCTIKGLKPDTEYTILVVGVSESWGWNSGGTSIKVRTLKPATVFASVTNRTSTSLEITLYNADENGTYYIYSTTDDGEIALGETSFTGTVFLDTGLTPGTNYNYIIYPADESFDDITVTGKTVPEYKIEATEVTDTSVALSWVQREGSVNTHKLQISTQTAGAVIPERFKNFSDVEGTSYTVTGLTPNSIYEFEIVSLSSDGNFTWMDPHYRIKVITEEALAPYAAVTERTTSSLTVQLYNVAASGTYYITAEKEDGTVVLDNVVFMGTTYKHTGLEERTVYNYTIRNEDGTVEVKATGTTKQIDKIWVVETGQDFVTLEWDVKEDCNGYHNVRITTETAGANIPERFNVTEDDLYNDKCLINASRYTFTELTPGATYNFKILARTNSWGDGGTYQITVTTLAPVEGLTAVRTTSTEIELMWPEEEGAAYYRVSMEDYAGQETVIDEHNTSRFAIISGLKTGRAYTFYVDAYNAADEPLSSLYLDARTQNLWNNDKGAEWYAEYSEKWCKGKGVFKHDSYQSTYMGVDVGFNIYLPEDYETSGKTYRVVYMLHGLGGDENSALGEWGEPYVNKMVEEEPLSNTAIIVYVNDANYGWYTDSVDGEYAADSTIIKELIPYVDANYRTNPTKKGRAIDGYSMGGYGAFRLAFKYPEVFACATSYAGGFAESLSEFSSMGWTDTLKNIFGYETDAQYAAEYFDRTSAYALLDKNIDKIKASGINFKMYVGENDFTLKYNQAMSAKMIEYGLITADAYTVVPGYDHNSSYYGNFCAESMYRYQGNLSDTPSETSDAYKVRVVSDVRDSRTNQSVCVFQPGQKIKFAVEIVNDNAAAIENAIVYVKIQNADNPKDMYIVKSDSVNVGANASAAVTLSDITLGTGKFYDMTYYVWDSGMKPLAMANTQIRNNF